MTSAEKFLMEIGNVDDEFIEEAMNYTMKKKFNFKPIIAVAACAVFALAAIPVAKHFTNNDLVDSGTTAGTVGTTAGATAGANGTTSTPVVGGIEGTFKVLYAGSGNDADSLIEQEIETDFDRLSENFIDKTKVGTKKTVELKGKNYTGIYVNSTKSDYYKDDTDNYFVEVDNKKVTFSINRETGVCRAFNIADSNFVIDTELTRDECYAKATEHLKNYVNDLENFELTLETKRVKGYGYYFVWQRTVNGYKTSEAFSVGIRENGEVYSHVLQSIDSMEKIDISTVDTGKINDVVDAKIKNIYGEYYDVKNSQNNVTLTRQANGKYIFVYDVNVEVANKETGNTNEFLNLLVVELD